MTIDIAQCNNDKYYDSSLKYCIYIYIYIDKNGNKMG